MKRNHLFGIVLGVIATITCFFSFTPLGWAAHSAPNQSNQAINRPALLIAPKPDVPIKLYAQPDVRQGSIGHALGGDRVTLLRQVGSNEGKTWNYVALDHSPKIEGWVEDTFLSFQTEPGGTPQRQTSSAEKSWSKLLKSWQNQNGAAEKPWSKLLKPLQPSGTAQPQPSGTAQTKKFNDQGGYSQKQQQQQQQQ